MHCTSFFLLFRLTAQTRLVEKCFDLKIDLFGEDEPSSYGNYIRFTWDLNSEFLKSFFNFYFFFDERIRI